MDGNAVEGFLGAKRVHLTASDQGGYFNTTYLQDIALVEIAGVKFIQGTRIGYRDCDYAGCKELVALSSVRNVIDLGDQPLIIRKMNVFYRMYVWWNAWFGK